MKRRLKTIVQFVTNPRLLLCLAIAWLITNGWSYVLFILGTWLGIGWMTALAGAYLAFLWLPVSPEKLVTVAIAIALLRRLFPDDQKTLAVLHRLRERVSAAVRQRREARSAARSEEKDPEP